MFWEPKDNSGNAFSKALSLQVLKIQKEEESCFIKTLIILLLCILCCSFSDALFSYHLINSKDAMNYEGFNQ